MCAYVCMHAWIMDDQYRDPGNLKRSEWARKVHKELQDLNPNLTNWTKLVSVCRWECRMYIHLLGPWTSIQNCIRGSQSGLSFTCLLRYISRLCLYSVQWLIAEFGGLTMWHEWFPKVTMEPQNFYWRQFASLPSSPSSCTSCISLLLLSAPGI
jgi:hypothetical protein